MNKPILPIDTTTGAWAQVRKYIEARQAELATVCISCTSTDVERSNAAQRIDELQMLIDAPAEAKRMTENRSDAPANIY